MVFSRNEGRKLIPRVVVYVKCQTGRAGGLCGTTEPAHEGSRQEVLEKRLCEGIGARRVGKVPTETRAIRLHPALGGMSTHPPTERCRGLEVPLM